MQAHAVRQQAFALLLHSSKLNFAHSKQSVPDNCLETLKIMLRPEEGLSQRRFSDLWGRRLGPLLSHFSTLFPQCIYALPVRYLQAGRTQGSERLHIQEHESTAPAGREAGGGPVKGLEVSQC